MKNIDVFTKRILSIALAISMVLCSASLFVFSIQSATASPSFKEKTKEINANIDRHENLYFPFITIKDEYLYIVGIDKTNNSIYMLKDPIEDIEPREHYFYSIYRNY